MSSSSSSPVAMADHIVIVGIDGMGGYFINKKLRDGTVEKGDTLEQLCPTFAALLKGKMEGFETVFSTTNAKTIFPPISTPAWASILSGLTPDQTGVESNVWPIKDVDPVTQEPLQPIPEVASPLCPDVPRTIFDLIPTATYKKARRSSDGNGGEEEEAVVKHLSILGWDGIGTYLSAKLPSIVETTKWTYDERRLPDGKLRSADEDVVVKFLEHFGADGAGAAASEGRPLPKFTFLHFDDIDHAGHQHEWGSEEYYSSWLVHDDKLARVMAALKDKSVAVVVISDHGGSEKGHGAMKTSHMYIPFMLLRTATCPPIVPTAHAAKAYFDKESGIAASDEKTIRISAIDVVPTLLALQGIEKDEPLRGKVLARYAEGGCD